MKIFKKAQMTYKYRIYHDFSYGWDEFGTEDDGITPIYYDTFEEAFKEVKDLVECDDFDEPYTYDQFKILRVQV